MKNSKGVSLISLIITIIVIIILAAVVIVNGMSAPESANKAVFINDCATIQDLVLSQRAIESASINNTTGDMNVSETSKVFIPVKISLGDVDGKMVSGNKVYTVGTTIFKNLKDPLTAADYAVPEFEEVTDSNGNKTYNVISNKYNIPVGVNGYRIDLAALQTSSKFGTEAFAAYATATRDLWYTTTGTGTTAPTKPAVENAQAITFSTGKQLKTSNVFVMDAESGIVYYAQGYKAKDDDGVTRVYYNSNTTVELKDDGTVA